jgi:hypothetical protein
MRLASLYDSRWDFTLYGEGFMALQGEETHYIGVDALIKQPTLDPDYVSVADYVKRRRGGGTFRADQVTPDKLAAQLEHDNQAALALVRGIDTRGNVALRYEVADVEAWAYLGLHLAEKLRGAIALEDFRAGGKAGDRQRAIQHLRKALGHWDQLIAVTRPIYKDMRLAHYNGNSFDANPHNLFHWALIRNEVARDVEVALAAGDRSHEPDMTGRGSIH